MKKKIGVLALTAALLLSGCGDASNSGAKGEAYVTVNGQTITRQQYDDELNMYMSLYATQLGLRDQIAQGMIQNVAMEQDLKEHHIEITDQELNDELENYKKGMGGEEAYQKVLRDNSISAEQYKNMVRGQILTNKHQKWYKETHPVTDEAIQKYYEENKEKFDTVRASHILVETEEEAKKALERVKEEDFATVAKELSTDTHSATNGGDLGFLAKGDTVPEFEKALFELAVGSISEPVKSEHGYHIIKVTEKGTLDSVKDEIKVELETADYMEYIDKLMEEAEVVYAEDSKNEEEDSSETESESQSTEQEGESQSEEAESTTDETDKN
jgi:foldase protein PrsA